MREALEMREAFLYEKAMKTDIYAVFFALITLFSFEKPKNLAVRIALFTKTLRFSLRYGRIDLF
jgi:hypothetical protein